MVHISTARRSLQNKAVILLLQRFRQILAFQLYRLFEKFGFDEAFGRSAVMQLLELKGSGDSKLLSNLVQADIIELVSGRGKGKYKFQK